MAENWLRTDEAEDVAGSIRHALRASDFVRDDPQAWKWIALALHSALQGACVCHLVTTANPVGAVTERNAGEWLRYFEDRRTNPEAKAPKTHLLSLPDLLRAIRKPHSAGDRRNSAGITITDSELDWLCRLHRIVRNQFVHFEPTGWSLEVSGIPDFAATVAHVIGDIQDIGYAFRHQDHGAGEEMRRNLDALKSVDWPVME